MDLARTLQVVIDSRGAVSGAKAAEGAFRSVGTSAKDMGDKLRDAQGRFVALGGGPGGSGSGGGGGGGAGGAMGGVVRSAVAVKAALASLATAATGLGLAAFTKGVVETQVAMDRMGNSLKFATGSAEAGAQAFEWVKNVSKTLGMDLTSAGTEFSKLAAATRGTGIDFKETQRIFLAVAKASTVMGLSADQTSGALNAIQQMVSKGTVSAEELRGQLGERLPGAFGMAARAMGVTTEKLGKMLEQGQISAKDMLPKLAQEMEKAFGPHAAKAAEQLQAKMNKLGTAWTEFKVAVANSGLIDLFTTLVELLTTALDKLAAFTKAYAATAAQFQTGFKPLDWLNSVNPFVVAQRAAMAAGEVSATPAPKAKSLQEMIADLAPKEDRPSHTMAAFKVAPSRWENFRAGIGGATFELNEKTGEFENKFTNSMKNMVQAGQDAVQAMASGFDGFFDGLISGTQSVSEAFRDMAKNVLQEIAKIIVRQAIINPIVGAIGGAMGINPTPAAAPAPRSHIGSVVGSTGVPTTLVNPAIFAGAPRFHNGLAPDEFPAILQRGERVVPKGQAGGGGISMPIQVNVTVDGGGAEDPEAGQRIGRQVAEQLEGMVRAILVREMGPRGIFA